MSVKPINLALENNGQQNSSKKQVSFRGLDGIIVPVMDGIERGGLPASFITQDVLGFMAPRIGTGLNRNREETGKRNWAFATSEFLREIISGPSTFAIPAIMLYAAKKHFGTAHDVTVKFIKGLGADFTQYAKNANGAELTKKDYYIHAFKNIIESSTNGEVKGEEALTKAKEFAQKFIDIESAKNKSFFKKLLGKPVQGSKQDLTAELTEDFVSLRKSHSNFNDSALTAHMKTGVDKEGKSVVTSKAFEGLMTHIRNFTNDAVSTVSKQMKKGGTNVEDAIKNFVTKRSKARNVLNLGITLTLASFFTIIPKIYKHKGGNPGLAGLEEKNQTANTSAPNKEVK